MRRSLTGFTARWSIIFLREIESPVFFSGLLDSCQYHQLCQHQNP